MSLNMTLPKYVFVCQTIAVNEAPGIIFNRVNSFPRSATYQDFGTRGMYLRREWVITSHSKLRDVITYPCLKDLLLASTSTKIRHWTGSASIYTMTCRISAPSHYLDQWRLLKIRRQWAVFNDNINETNQITVTKLQFKLSSVIRHQFVQGCEIMLAISC